MYGVDAIRVQTTPCSALSSDNSMHAQYKGCACMELSELVESMELSELTELDLVPST